MRHRRDRDSVGFTTSVLQHSMKKEPLQLLEPARKPGERGGPCRAAAGKRVSTECCVTVARLPRLVDLVNSPKRPEVGATQTSMPKQHMRNATSTGWAEPNSGIF